MGTISHASMGFCKRCIVQCASSPTLSASQAVLLGTDCLRRGTTYCLPHSENRMYIAQVESVQLASESAHKQLELELANAKHNAAQAAAAHKSAAASWQGELDWQKSEVLHMP